jgi:peptidoglycan-N-acetylglucosamine deacetylase
MDLVKIPWVFKKAFPGVLWNIPGKKPTLYLTFDDGPEPETTNHLLSILDTYQAKATFFCIGRNVERNPDLYPQLTDHGHAVGNHTYSHLKGWHVPNHEYYNDIALAAKYIPSGLYRPPYGMITPAQIRYLKTIYRIVLWETMSYDFDPYTSPEKCLNNVLRNARDGSVIVFHDSIKASRKVLYALPRVLEYFSEKRFEFKAITKEQL